MKLQCALLILWSVTTTVYPAHARQKLDELTIPKTSSPPTVSSYAPLPPDFPSALIDEGDPEYVNNLRDIWTQLSAKTQEELAIFGALDKPCIIIKCMGISSDKMKSLASAVSTLKTNQETALYGKQQGISAVIGMIIAGISLLISIVTFYLNRRTRVRIT